MPESPLPQLVRDTLSERRTWPRAPDEDPLQSLPPHAAVLLLVDERELPILLATTQHLRRFVQSRLRPAEQEPQKRADLHMVTRGVLWRAVTSPFEARWRHYRLARLLYPQNYRKLVSFGPAWFLNVDWTSQIPEIRVTNRIWRAPGELVGPWPARKQAQTALEGLWDLFDLCRYPDEVRKAPRGKRCAYYDMGRCDAPCDGTAPPGPYVERCRAAWRFASGDVQAWNIDAEARMRAAARSREYELAARIKQQIGFAERWRREWSGFVRREHDLNYLLAVPVTRRRAFKLFLLLAGDLREGPVYRDRELASAAPAWAANELSAASGVTDAVLRMEQTWLVAHYLHRSESDRAIVLPLSERTLPPDLQDVLAARLAVLRNDTNKGRTAGRTPTTPPSGDQPSSSSSVSI